MADALISIEVPDFSIDVPEFYNGIFENRCLCYGIDDGLPNLNFIDNNFSNGN